MRQGRLRPATSLGALAFGVTLALPGVVRAAEPAKAPTFTKDIAPIFQEKCEACHRPDSIADRKSVV